MGEESQYKGELWTKQAIKLLNLFSWQKVGDSGMDIEGSDEAKKYGVDCLYICDNPAKSIPESIIIEAKCYATKNVNNTVLNDWVKTLNGKITNLRGTQQLYEKYPQLSNCTDLKIGLIFIWFSDTDNYKKFRPKFLGMLENIKVSQSTLKNGVFNKIHIIDNDIISKLCSMHGVIKELKDFEFYYHSQFINDKAVTRSKVLSLDYIFSKYILGQDKSTNVNLVFYWGNLTINSFKFLKKALSSFAFIDKSRKLIIYKYVRDDDFRTIKSDIENLFKEDEIEFEIKDMDSYFELPAFITND